MLICGKLSTIIPFVLSLSVFYRYRASLRVRCELRYSALASDEPLRNLAHKKRAVMSLFF